MLKSFRHFRQRSKPSENRRKSSEVAGTFSAIPVISEKITDIGTFRLFIQNFR